MRKYTTPEVIEFMNETEEEIVLEWGDIHEEDKLKSEEIKKRLLELDITKRKLRGIIIRTSTSKKGGN